MRIVMQAMTKMKDRNIRIGQSSDHLARSIISLTFSEINRTNSSNIPDKDDDGSDPELSFDDIDDDEDMIEIEQALEGLVAFT